MSTEKHGLPDGMTAQGPYSAEQQLQPENTQRNGSTSKPGISQSTTTPGFMNSLIRRDHVDLILLTCAFCSGLVDSSMFVAYTTFVSMQTGNTIFIALAVSSQGPQPDAWTRPFLAVLFFILGSLFFSRLFLLLGSPRRRLTLLVDFSLQTLFVVIAAAILQSGVISSDVPETAAREVYPLALAPIALLAFQSAGQITASRALEVGELPTVVITSLLCDLFSDPNLLAGPRGNVKRNRRVAGFLLTFVGGVVGGWMGKRLDTIAPALWLAAGLKLCMTVAWGLWPRERTVVGSKA